MSADIYSPCPCGSGKKLKFCCIAIVDEMDRISKLLEGNQPHVALQQLEALAKKHPTSTWVGTTRAIIYLEINEVETARQLLTTLLEDHPDHELTIALYAAAMLQTEGLDGAKKALHRAFQKAAKKEPGIVCDLASSVAGIHASQGKMMAAREHVALALRLAPDEHRQQLFVQLLELDGAENIPYPLRGTHQLPAVTGSEEILKEVRKAQKYAGVGCWSTAAEVFTTLADAHPDRGEFWHAAGLCRAWDGNEKTAAEALHRAGRIYIDPGMAVECETMAQLLDERTSTDVTDLCLYEGHVQSVSRLLTALDSLPRLQRVKVPAKEEDRVVPVAAYLVLESEWTEPEDGQITLENVARYSCRVNVYDVGAEENTPAVLSLVGLRGPGLDEGKTLLTSSVAEMIEWKTDGSQPKVVATFSAESRIFLNNWYLPDRMPLIRRRELYSELWQSIAQDKWPNLQLRALEGKTPLQAVGDKSLGVALLGALYAIDALAQRNEKGLGIKSLCGRLGISPLPKLEITEETNPGGLSNLQLNRLPFDKLNDHQLQTVATRSLMVQHDETLYEVLKVVAQRPDSFMAMERPRVYRTLTDICIAEGKRDEAFSWLDRGRNLVVNDGKSAFQHIWGWDMAELGLRLEDPQDPRLNDLLSRFVNYYTPKVPQIRPHVEQMLAACGVPSPWDSARISIAGHDSPSSRLWSPESAEPVPAGGSKLWLPGQ